MGCGWIRRDCLKVRSAAQPFASLPSGPSVVLSGEPEVRMPFEAAGLMGVVVTGSGVNICTRKGLRLKIGAPVPELLVTSCYA